VTITCKKTGLTTTLTFANKGYFKGENKCERFAFFFHIRMQQDAPLSGERVQKEQLLSVSSLSLSLGEKEKHMSVLYLSPKKKNTRIYFLGMRGV
jgi:hypothetical protein